MMLKKKICMTVTICFAVWILAAVTFVPACFAVDATGANAAIGQAERDLCSAYVAVDNAEAAGADVSALLNELRGAADSLSQAWAAFRTADYANANMLAVKCSHALNGVAVDAANLKIDAEKEHSDSLLLSGAGSCVGLVLLLVFGLLGWKLLKKRYLRRVLDMKPQMEEAR
jgi:hypothetical protein